ncbi:hypothetical protein LOAG_05383 [Loa loa]|uniref:Uncharacterized protein n=1 Tax=Loa loa TaxID=7209 RepID=A0A1S0U022_LOALO|nr:hypothetical protein LOAG_05383 [Loa loa]EFO23105.1 hypothetical protein LOAG_05383 [Loa loa]
MTCANDYDRNDYFNNHWTSSDSERFLPEMSSEDSLDEISDKMDSSSEVELNVAVAKCDKKKSFSGSDSELNCTSNIHSPDSWTNAIHERYTNKLHFNSRLDCESEEMPDLVDGNFMNDVEISDRNSGDELPDEADDEFIMEQFEKLIIRRNKKDNDARLRWLAFLREQKEAEEEEKQFQAYWERRHQEDKDLWRDKVELSS